MNGAKVETFQLERDTHSSLSSPTIWRVWWRHCMVFCMISCTSGCSHEIPCNAANKLDYFLIRDEKLLLLPYLNSPSVFVSSKQISYWHHSDITAVIKYKLFRSRPLCLSSDSSWAILWLSAKKFVLKQLSSILLTLTSSTPASYTH